MLARKRQRRHGHLRADWPAHAVHFGTQPFQVMRRGMSRSVEWRVLGTNGMPGISRLVLTALFLGVCSLASPGQQTDGQTRSVQQSTAPTALVPAPAKSPQVDGEGNATFTLAMPNAAKVELRLEGVRDPIPMTKDAEGAWTVTVPKLAPEY